MEGIVHANRRDASSSAPVWEVYPFKLELLIPEKEFHQTRARMRMEAGYTALDLVREAMDEQTLWNTRTALEAAQDRLRLADAMNLSASERNLLGVMLG